MGWKLDETDRKMLGILRHDARIANRKLGKMVGLSEPAARRRVAALVAAGVIRRFTIDVEESGGVSAIVFISTSPHMPAEKIMEKLKGEEGVGSAWELSGDIDVAITLFAPDIEALNRRIDEIRAFEGIKKTKLSVILKKWK
jgi:DNA-binding Lrp family transcriptional regulator